MGDSETSGKPVLVSACLLGLPTRYDGKSKGSRNVLDYLTDNNMIPIPVCPEQLAGMTTPRDKTFFQKGDGFAVLDGSGQAVSVTGASMNEVFCRGAKMTLQVAKLSHSQMALLKERSPSCGVHQVYLEGEIVPGTGVAAAALKLAGLEVISEEDI